LTLQWVQILRGRGDRLSGAEGRGAFRREAADREGRGGSLP
jgi:hypothetical protein